jgi:class 3 adenylate cyclase
LQAFCQSARRAGGSLPDSLVMVVTAMFADLQGVSTLPEKQSPEVLTG